MVEFVPRQFSYDLFFFPFFIILLRDGETKKILRERECEREKRKNERERERETHVLT